MKSWIKILFIFLFLSFIFLPKNIEAKSGCCSHHDGVCGCRCCDGSSLSKTCMTPECSGGGATQIVKPIKNISTTIPIKKPIPTTKVPPTREQTQIIKPTLKSTPSLVLSPTEIISPTKTKSIVSNLKNKTETKTIKQKNKFSGFLSWFFNKN